MNLDLYLKLINKLTIIIPTYQRHDFMVRSMRYWSGKGINVIYIDGSKTILSESVLNGMDKNIKYIHNPKPVYDRQLSAINLFNTEYVMWGCDDEFYIPSALAACVAKLSSDPEIVACCGRALGIDWRNNKVVGYNEYPKLKNLNLNEENPIERLKKHFSNYVPGHFFSVCRSDVFKKCVKESFSHEYSLFAASELQFEFFVVYSGKTLVIPELMWIRSGECDPIRGNSPSLITSENIFKWWFDKIREKEKTLFIKDMENSCKKINLHNYNNYDLNVENIFNLMVKNNKISFLKKLYALLPNFLRNIIKNLFKIFGYDLTKKTPFLNAGNSLKKTGVRVDLDELETLESYINSFYKNRKKINL